MSQLMRFFERFNNITLDYTHTDKHIHSNWTDGKGSILQIAKKADETGLICIAITEHVRANSTYFSNYIDEIRQVNKKFRVKILTGLEARVCNFSGNIDVPRGALNKAQIKIASVHRFSMGNRLYYPEQFDKRICQEIELELSVSALKKRRFNVLGHPGGMSLGVYKEFPTSFFEEIIIQCKKNEIAFELNSRYHSPVLKYLKPLLKKHNPFVSIGSDAHRVQEVGKCVNILK